MLRANSAVAVRAGRDKVTSTGPAVRELEACLDRIERYNPTVNALITVTATSALDAARNADAAQGAG